MSLPTTIRRFEVRSIDIPLREPFGIAQGAQTVAANLEVTVELEDGTRGIGESAPFPAFNGETQASSRRAIEDARDLVVSQDARAFRRIAWALRDAGAPGSARCAIETAVLDALTRHAGLPLWSFFGGASTHVVTDVTITTGTVKRGVETATSFAREGFRTFKIKVGGVSLTLDLERIVAVAEAVPSATLTLDANASMTAEDAVTLALEARARGVTVTLFEQPVGADDLEGMREVGQKTKLPIAADESVASATDAIRIVETKAASIINIKLMKTGIVEALEIAAIARAAGLGLMIGGLVESELAMTTSACFAAGLGGFEVVDLDTPLFLAERVYDGGFVRTGDRLDLASIAQGHGVSPRRSTR